MSGDPVIVAARRTALGTRGRIHAGHTVDDLAAAAAAAALRDSGISGSDIADVLLGNCVGPGGNPARRVALAVGLGDRVPGSTIDRQCGSGLAAVIDAATAMRAGDYRPRLAGGAESASTAPVRSIEGKPYDRAPFTPPGHPDPDMPAAADDLARFDGIPRDRQDAHAIRSHARALAARDAGLFDAEIVALGSARMDDGIGVPEAVIRRSSPLYPGGTVTGGNTTRIGDGAAMVLLADGGSGLALRAHAIVGCDPALPGIGAAAAIADLLDRTGVDLPEVKALEIVEAFAAQSLAVLDRLEIAEDDPRVCAEGGALAIGHPWGASAAVSVVRLFSRLVRKDLPRGTLAIAGASVGGGMGVAALFERV